MQMGAVKYYCSKNKTKYIVFISLFPDFETKLHTKKSRFINTAMNHKQILQVLDRNRKQCHTPMNTAVNGRAS